MKNATRAIMLAALLTAAVAAQAPPAQPVDVERLGPQVGEVVPSFSAIDQFGRTQTLQSAMGPNGVMLFFNRSADWWPYCKAQLVELQARGAEFRTLGIGVVALTYDAPEAIKKFADERKIELPILSDQDHSIVLRYGILNQQFQPGHRNYGIPHPGTFILNREGRVVARYFEEEFQYRNTSASIALKIGQPMRGMGAAIRQATPHLDLSAFLTDETVAPGHRFSIVVDITPKPGTRIVAPGQPSYRVVALSLESGDNLRTYPVHYPASGEFALAGNARLQAYAQPLRLVQDVAVVVNDAMRKLAQTPGSTVTLKGVLDYQACTQTACDPPQQVPLSWTVVLKPLG